jgi:hypothetical protein
VGLRVLPLLNLELTLDFQPFAFDVITNIAIEYMQDLGRTLTMYLNNVDQRKKFTEEVVPLPP